MSDPPPDVRAYVERVAGVLHQELGNGLLGVYLHGSAVLGGFEATRSDVDVLAVSEGRTSGEARRRIAERLSTAALPCPGVGLEFGLISGASLEPITRAPTFELDLWSPVGGTDRFTDGEGHPGGTDYPMHVAVCRGHGLAVFGPPPAAVFPEVPRAWLLEAFAGDLAWAEERELWSYGVLNACRGLRYLEDGVLCSKLEGAVWAREGARVEDASAIDAAMARQRGADVDGPDPGRAVSFVSGVREALRREAVMKA